jgi:hypothetical protein
MKKIIAIGVLTGIVVFVFLNTFASQIEASATNEKKEG